LCTHKSIPAILLTFAKVTCQFQWTVSFNSYLNLFVIECSWFYWHWYLQIVLLIENILFFPASLLNIRLLTEPQHYFWSGPWTVTWQANPSSLNYLPMTLQSISLSCSRTLLHPITLFFFMTTHYFNLTSLPMKTFYARTYEWR
jgi:hypothetical protein